ncbi:MAG TPA: globin domain-containing protein [Actinocrinis sp.]|jgi:ferredoxin-NADP reductase/truncated hemoglobin YjbI|uniref:globin domain-containing protein n=1 Tax=Actinocrinis sp. TaxID=1920516 RepID=UPI002DDDBA25|nr:globin domain-containing protein [Actinocrinis sp.]HEV3173182.1 globin domain-containing protein [Actinocrinis sp.]
MTLDPKLIHQSFALVEDSAEKVTGHFYALLFLEDPTLRDMFPPMMDTQRDRLLSALVQVVHHAHEPHTLVDYLQQLGRDHRKFGVRPEHYDTVGRCLIAAMKRFARPGWTAEMDAAWGAAFQLIAGTMIGAAQEAAKTTPASWTGRVVEHRRPTASLAVFTVEPDQPYPFKAGQYAAIETLRWPRIWRQYSFANAPRADGLLTFHVRAVGGGWVSSALVNHLRVGDTVRLGPAVGNLRCDSSSMADVLMVGGGTGIAPLMAIVEDMGRWNTSRRVSFFYGVRKSTDLYALRALEHLRDRCPWLRIVPCVSHEQGYRGEQGMLPDVLTRHGSEWADWAGHDVLLSGSAPMMRATLARLVELNVPSARIKFDAFSEQTDIYLGLKKMEREERPSPARKVLTSGPGDQPLQQAPERLPERHPGRRNQASKSSATSSEVGSDWQVSTNPSIFSSGSRA